MELNSMAELVTISTARLLHNKQQEAAILFQAAQEHGFFYLDFQGSPFANMISIAEEVFAIAKELFSLETDEKMQFDVDKLGGLKLNG
jgi:isopenicillin N synthase-like dioxygenase